MNLRMSAILVTTAAVSFYVGSSCKSSSGGSQILNETDVATEAPSGGNITDGAGFENAMSNDFKNFRNEFVGLPAPGGTNGIQVSSQKVANLLDIIVTKLEADEYKDPDMLMVAAQLYPLRSMRGIVWRMSDIVEDNDADGFHSMVVTGLMQIATGTRLFMPEDDADASGSTSWKAISRYFAYPYQGIKPKFKTVSQFQDYLQAEVLPDMGVAIDTIRKFTVPADKPVVWDNLIVFGRNSFNNDTDLKDRYTTLYEAERRLLLSGLYAMRHNMYWAIEYNMDKFPQFVNKMGKLIGMDGFLFSSVTGMSAKDRSEVICPNRSPQNLSCGGEFSKLFTRRNKVNLSKALQNLENSVRLAEEAWTLTKDRTDRSFADFQLLDPARIIPWARINDHTLARIRQFVNGNGLRSSVTGRVIRFDIKKFYANPPQDMKVFLPTMWDSSKRRFTISGINDVRNYEYGMSVRWDEKAYNRYFADITEGTEVPGVLTDMAQAWGGWVGAVPLTTMSMVF